MSNFLALLTSATALLNVILDALRRIRIAKGVQNIKEEIAEKSDEKTKKNLEEIL